jgi:hypothetical protein
MENRSVGDLPHGGLASSNRAFFVLTSSGPGRVIRLATSLARDNAKKFSQATQFKLAAKPCQTHNSNYTMCSVDGLLCAQQSERVQCKSTNELIMWWEVFAHRYLPPPHIMVTPTWSRRHHDDNRLPYQCCSHRIANDMVISAFSTRARVNPCLNDHICCDPMVLADLNFCAKVYQFLNGCIQLGAFAEQATLPKWKKILDVRHSETWIHIKMWIHVLIPSRYYKMAVSFQTEPKMKWPSVKQIFSSTTSRHGLPEDTLPLIFRCCKHDWWGKLPSNSLCLQSYCLAMVGHIVAHSVVITQVYISETLFIAPDFVCNMPLPVMLSCALARLIHYAASVCIYCIL